MNPLQWFRDWSLRTLARWLQALTLLLFCGIAALFMQMQSSNAALERNAAKLERNATMLERQLSADEMRDSTLYRLGVGVWSWANGLDDESGPVLHLGEGLMRLFGIDRNRPPKTLTEFLALIRADDRAWFARLISDKAMIGRTYNVVFHLANGRIVRVNGSILQRIDATEPTLLGSCLPATEMEYRTSLATIPQAILR